VSEFADFERILREPSQGDYTGPLSGSLATPGHVTSLLPTSRGVPLVNGVNYTHKDIIDYVLSNPGVSQNHVAAHFGYSASYLSQLMVSDAFQSEFAKRREAMVDPVVAANVKLNFEAMVLRSQEILLEKLSLPAHQIPDQLALRALELSSRAAGYGAKDQAPSVVVNVDTHLEALGANLERLLDRKRPPLDFVDVGEETGNEA
jgi:hypothetical protein